MQECKVEKAFKKYVRKISDLYDKTKDVVRCNKLTFIPPACDCEKCKKKKGGSK